jgi:hypothetical protein
MTPWQMLSHGAVSSLNLWVLQSAGEDTRGRKTLCVSNLAPSFQLPGMTPMCSSNLSPLPINIHIIHETPL